MKLIITLFVCFLTVQLTISQEIKLQPDLVLSAKKAAMEIKMRKNTPLDPVSVNSQIVWSADRTQLAVVVKASIMEGWHIYAYVPDSQPYITTETRLILPEGVAPIGSWDISPSEPFEEGIYIYQDQPVFIRFCSVKKYSKSVISAGLYFQTCDSHKCFAPKSEIKEISI